MFAKFTPVAIGATLCYANILVFQTAKWAPFPSPQWEHSPPLSASSSDAKTQRRHTSPEQFTISSPRPRIEHDPQQRPNNWGKKLSGLVRVSSYTDSPDESGSFLSSRDIESDKEYRQEGEAGAFASSSSPLQPAANRATRAWTPPRKRPVFTEWEDSDAHQDALLLQSAVLDTKPQGRPARFPSIDQRVRLYMSNWYHPPCSTLSAHHFELRPNASWWVQEQPSAQQVALNQTLNDRFFHVNSTPGMDLVFSMDKTSIAACIANSSMGARKYCEDVEDTAFTALPSGSTITNGETGSSMTFPLLFQFGDSKASKNYGSLNVPHIRKIRSVALDSSFINDSSTCHESPRQALPTLNQNGYLQPVLWLLNSERHFGLLSTVLEKDDITPWARKIPQAVFRGALSGRTRDGYSPDLDDLTNCQRIRRCRLVLEHDKSQLVNARLTKTHDAVPHTVAGIDVVDARNRKLTIEDQLKYKAIIMLEGNDVSSGLKWALLSSSVVLMPVPTYTSWAMEEWLEPWVHYVPLKDDLSNVEEQMQWIIDHDAEAQAITLRATLWMKDLVLHEDAAADDAKIRQAILQRYAQHWTPIVEHDPMHEVNK